MGRQKIEIEKIDDKNRRMVSFTKRRQGLFKKAAAACIKCDAKIAVIAFSGAGKLFSFGHSSVDSVIDRYLTGVEEEENKNNKPDDHQIRVGGDGGNFWWDNIQMEELDSIDKLLDMENKLLSLKKNVTRKLEKLASSSSSSSIAEATINSTVTTAAVSAEASSVTIPTAAVSAESSFVTITNAVVSAEASAVTTTTTASQENGEDCSMFFMEGDGGFFWDSDEIANLLKSPNHDDDDAIWKQLSPLNDLGYCNSV